MFLPLMPVFSTVGDPTMRRRAYFRMNRGQRAIPDIHSTNYNYNLIKILRL